MKKEKKSVYVSSIHFSLNASDILMGQPTQHATRNTWRFADRHRTTDLILFLRCVHAITHCLKKRN
jgi:hypothetical protein